MFYVVDEYNVRFSEDRTCLIEAPKTLSGEYRVPESVKKVEDKAFSNCVNLEKVTLSPSLNIIGDYVFYNCQSLKAIEFHSDINHIGESCFDGCISLTDISIPSSVKSIGKNAFRDCTVLKEIELPDSCMCGDGVFSGCSSLYHITIPKSWEEIPCGVFNGCKSIEYIKLPSNIKKICARAYGNCSKLRVIDVGDGVEEIESVAFENCVNLHQLRIGPSVKTIGNGCFFRCKALKVVFWDAINCSDFRLQDSPFAWKIEKLLDFRDRYVVESSVEHVYFGDSVKHIPNFLCAGMSHLEELFLPEGVDSMGGGAFAKCNPKYVNINKNITPEILRNIFSEYWPIVRGNYIDGSDCYVENRIFSTTNMFYYCDRIEEIHVSSQNEHYASRNGSLYDKNFSTLYKIGSKGITDSGKLSVNVEKIADFAGMNLGLTDLEIYGCGSIGNFAFYGCEKLQSVSFKPAEQSSFKQEPLRNELEIGTGTFGYCHKLEELYVDVDNVHFPYRLWNSILEDNCYLGDREELDISNQIRRISFGPHITKVPSFVTQLTAINMLLLPKNIIDVESGFPPMLRQLELFEDNSVTGRNFKYENGFVISNDGCVLYKFIGSNEEIYVPNGVTQIANNAFFHSDAKRIILPDSVKNIGESSFESSCIEEFVAPNNLETINNCAFKDCYNLTKVLLNNNLKEIGPGTFTNCMVLKHLSIPGATNVSHDIVNGCSSLEELRIDEHIDISSSLTGLKRIVWDRKDSKYDGFFVEDDGKDNSIAHQIESVTFTDRVESIPECFAKHMNIREVEVPESVKRIGRDAFYYCRKLEKITIHSMDIVFEPNFCHFNDASIFIYNDFMPCTPTKIIYKGKDVTELLQENNRKLIEQEKDAEADYADFEQWCNDGFETAFEGDPEAIGGIFD